MHFCNGGVPSSIASLVIQQKLLQSSPLYSAMNLDQLPHEVSEVATTSIVTILHYWRFKNLQLSDLLSRANFMWNNNLRNVIKTFQDPAFLVCFKYATEGDRRNENTAFLSLKEIFKANHLDNQIEDIIAAGQSALIRGEIEEKSGLPDVLEYLESQIAKEMSPKLIIGEFDIQKPSENTLRDVFRKLEIACSIHKMDASKATWLLEQLSGSSYEYKLFTIMHWWLTYDDDATLPNAVLNELRVHLRKSTRSAMNRVRDDSQQLLLGDNTAALNDKFGLKSIYHEWKAFMKVALQDDV
ncbi:hypothetical protein CCR75_001042 [Bremia lactucae]|uniref:Uncharacterized protein n=1 Tax=Bremia lactucae TaxID=4779 RepID=A0A976FRH8_BRELC|nr:hypothetical protein CCR75_001042 [Bremia lactucae]